MNYKIIDGEKVYGYRWIILALMGLACIVVNGSTLVFAGMAGILLNPTGPWAFDAQQFMMLTSCSYLTGFLFCMVTGTMADRMGIKKVLVIGLAISAIGAILRIFWGGFAGMFVTSVIFGFGLAALNANSAKIISLWFPGKMISVAMGIYLCCATVGCALAVPLAGMATEPTPVFVAVAVLSVIVAVLWAVLYKKHPDNEQRIVEPVMKHLGVVVKSKNLWVACLVIGFVTEVYTSEDYTSVKRIASQSETGSATTIISGYLVAALSGDPTVGGKALDYTFATLPSSICNITCSVGGIMFPLIFSKTHNEKWWLVGLCAAVIVGIGIYWFMLDGIATAVGVMIVSVLVGGVLPLSKALPAQLPDISREHMGAAGGLHSTIQNAFAFLIPSYVVAPICGLNYDLLNGAAYAILTALVLISALFLPKLVTGNRASAAEESSK